MLCKISLGIIAPLIICEIQCNIIVLIVSAVGLAVNVIVPLMSYEIQCNIRILIFSAMGIAGGVIVPFILLGVVGVLLFKRSRHKQGLHRIMVL